MRERSVGERIAVAILSLSSAASTSRLSLSSSRSADMAANSDPQQSWSWPRNTRSFSIAISAGSAAALAEAALLSPFNSSAWNGVVLGGVVLPPSSPATRRRSTPGSTILGQSDAPKGKK